MLARDAKTKGLVARPQAKPLPAKAGRVPARVLREVWTRDGGRCQHPLASGGICGSRERVEVHHVVARALGGPATVDNLRIVCRVHNALLARRAFGERYVAAAVAHRRTEVASCERGR